ncbi:uncharacterized protein LOC101862840 [Aplysia californica]|uniref:Uncharacterized protein LOC101862840 n=1 Tax=Aplysia californica TaxID=6500 RepID=A0ABM1VSU0_APLCA|nr:uncharacterized protein LOC101862840 [Aplysia californica]
MTSSTADNDAALKAELEEVKKEVPTIEDVKLIAAVPALVRAEIKITDHKQVAVTCMFQPSYPTVPVVTELRSKTLADKLLDGLARICDAEAKKLEGKPQTVHIIRYVKTFIEENPLCVCSDEISAVKKLLNDSDDVKLKQKTSQIVLKVCQEQYFVGLRISVPDDYPAKQVVPEITEHNFPEFLRVNFQAQAVEIARQCVHPPLKKNPKDPPFVPKPSLQPVCEYIIRDCVKKFPLEICPLCNERVLPVDPSNESASRGKNRVEKVYCGHLFHFICLNRHMKTPPFTGGKLCPGCGKQIFHEKWKISAEVMENRWAHKQAKQRELEEVVDFLG